MNWLFPKIGFRKAFEMLGAAFVGALVAGSYGVIHDQITYSISSEYFMCLKFDQFRYADFGFPARLFVAEIGFLATWWVGLIAGWFLARTAAPTCPSGKAWSRWMKGMAIIWVIAAVSGIFGWTLAHFNQPPAAHWVEWCRELGVEDVRAFVKVGTIHNAGYLGGLVGLTAAIVWSLRARKPDESAQ